MGVQFVHETFSHASFDVSKGYFPDKIAINWTVKNNLEDIEYIVVYRRELTNVQQNYVKIATLPAITTNYEDKYVQGGTLYEYRIDAVGLPGFSGTGTELRDYITGIGYRNPTAIITGNINFEGGNPVQTVIIEAEPSNGDENTKRSGINIPKETGLDINFVNKPITDKYTFQTWLKPSGGTFDTSEYIDLFVLQNASYLDTHKTQIKVNLEDTTPYIEFNIQGAIYRLYNYIPAGRINAKGDETLLPIADFLTDFTHVTVIVEENTIPRLLINGTEIQQEDVDSFNTELRKVNPDFQGPDYSVTIPTQTTSLLSATGTVEEYNHFIVGSIGSKSIYLDELRIWKSTLTEARVHDDFHRYISGDDADLISYFRFDEGVGRYAYDLSHEGFEYNKNRAFLDGELAQDIPHWTSAVNDLPRKNQLGFLGITDKNGSYIISAIPYKGTGESYNISPRLGVHQFEPNQQIIYLGEDTPVVNQVNFTDVSSFIYRGKILYDTKGVFKSFVELNSPDPANPSFQGLTDGDQYVSNSSPGLLDEGYNYYTRGPQKFSKGEYWYNNAGTTDDVSDDYLERYARIASEGVNILIDNQIVLDENNTPVVSDSEGNFEISVPIGNHYISVAKTGHTFEYNGRFPASTSQTSEFFEDAQEQVIFVDKTRVDIVGRVVGGTVEAAKTIGFGDQGTYAINYEDKNNIQQQEIVSSVNNIGTANLTLSYAPPGASATGNTQFSFSTNAETGEYRVKALPLMYTINSIGGLTIPTNSDISILEANESLDFSSNITITKTPTYTSANGEEVTGKPYHFEKSFVYRATPVLNALSQVGEDMLDLPDGTSVKTAGTGYLFYNQFGYYTIELSRYEPYFNYDTNSNGIEFQVPIKDGELIITNNLALQDSEKIIINEEDESLISYQFRGGLPSTVAPYTKSLNMFYRINSIDYPVQNYTNKAILLGGESDGSQTFVTEAPDIPDLILRDPPGSESSATIESGESVSFTTTNKIATNTNVNNETKLLLGIRFAAGGGLLGPVVDTQTNNDFIAGIGLSVASNDATSLTKTYTFSQQISTSDDPSLVGSRADVYIGQSKNYYYGSFNNIGVSTIKDTATLELTNDDGVEILINKQKALYFNEEPSDTFFAYSQAYIIDELIPSLEFFISQIQQGSLIPGEAGVSSEDQYIEQINQWKSVIRENEKTKYDAKNNRDQLKEDTESYVQNEIKQIKAALLSGSDPSSEAILNIRLQDSQSLLKLINSNFEENISFDSSAGAITRSIETSLVRNKTNSIEVDIEESLAITFGFTFNKFGFLNTTSTKFNQTLGTELSEETETTTNINYTLQDGDANNLFSVDVVNSFDGNGPIFSLIGGVSSCPYERAEKSLFYNKASYITPDYDNPDYVVENIELLPETSREELGYATQQLEKPEITVEIANISNVPESETAQFKLSLLNLSASETTTSFVLQVNPASNPNNAVINVDPQGLIFSDVPYNEPIDYLLTLDKSVGDIYEYEDIIVEFKSICDGSIVSSVSLSAFFTPSCSSVAISSPVNNWVFNIDQAFNNDNTSNSLPIKLVDYNINYESFEKIDLQYRLISSPSWTNLHTYYTSQDYLDASESTNNVSVIDTPEINYNWDIVGTNVNNGNYEVRAISSCMNGTEYISDVITGRIDLDAPVVFGTPTPTDGILSYGEDIVVRFNQPISYNQAVSLIQVTGQTNQQEINHNVSVNFNGANNTVNINNPLFQTGDFTLEFWMNNATTTANATILSQENGVNIGLENGQIRFEFAGNTVSGSIINDNLFHHYAFVYNSDEGTISIYEDSSDIAVLEVAQNVQYSYNNPIVIGGNTFVGNMHDLRIWSKSLTLSDVASNLNTKYLGNERNLIGLWPMDEGNGTIANDIARFKHAVVNTDWDIKPSGTSYEFENNQYLACDDVSIVQINDQMDVTLSFWVKTDVAQQATLFSNGRGDDQDIASSNGTRNKWAINLATDGNLNLMNENNSYELTTTSVTDGNWHHVAVLLNRQGSLRTYIDSDLVSTNNSENISAFYGDKIWLGARGHKDLAGIETTDNHFTGYLSEVRLWNTLRDTKQVDRDRFFEIDFNTPGLYFYMKMNEPGALANPLPSYYHIDVNAQVFSSNAIINAGTSNYSEDAPPIKPTRDLTNFIVDYVINGDELIIKPNVTHPSVIENQVLDITVNRMFDDVNNVQQSPVTWTAYIDKNQLNWSIDGQSEIVEKNIPFNQGGTFEIEVRNNGGTSTQFNISNIPSWLSLTASSGTIAPASVITITGTTEQELSVGNYQHDMYLNSDYGYDEKIQLNLNVNSVGPEWEVNPADFDYSLNIVGKINIDGVFAENNTDTVAAFVNGELRGVSSLFYDEDYDEYFVFLTVYANQSSGEEISFKVWDASTDVIYPVTISNKLTIPFVDNNIMGTKQAPEIFENSDELYQSINLNSGWTWTSFFVNDANLSDINTLTADLNLATSDRILSNSPSLLETYQQYNDPNLSGWSGSITSVAGGLNTNQMYKVYTNNTNTLNVSGIKVDLNTWSFPIQENWNWLPYVVSRNTPLNEALANFNATDGDVIKSQNKFAIYDALNNSWSGNLNFLEQGKGYMLKSAENQIFTYPSYLDENLSKSSIVNSAKRSSSTVETTTFNKYASNMNAIVKIPADYSMLKIYNSNGEIRGESEAINIDGENLHFISIFSDTSEKLTFYIQKSDGSKEEITSESVQFKNNAVLGTILNPIVIGTLDEEIQIFPNTFDDYLKINFKKQQTNVAVKIYSTIGQVSYQKNYKMDQNNKLLILNDFNLSSGNYIIKVVTDSNTVIKHLIKK
ncbi:LamG domain-containing protein [Tenacibaculum pacificus]|uniref:LamG-like jellyroll fold domain-containing protein n=1 Tax=Tenacibaculum pacificus TaxID=3018314 RepID=UPI0022F38961|nr:LamG-like jellyroll fold domain-containing protein [Tenacibaculum pacificus]WBX74477.1 LamG domain-containing protein [Tenacibaculum pacificus]